MSQKKMIRNNHRGVIASLKRSHNEKPEYG
jgi:hypothetical protein